MHIHSNVSILPLREKKKIAQVLNMSVQCYKKKKQQSTINCIIYQNS